MKWEAVVSIVETKDFFLIYIGKDRAYFIPKTALASPSELDALRTLFQDQAPDRFQQEKESSARSLALPNPRISRQTRAGWNSGEGRASGRR